MALRIPCSRLAVIFWKKKNKAKQLHWNLLGRTCSYMFKDNNYHVLSCRKIYVYIFFLRNIICIYYLRKYRAIWCSHFNPGRLFYLLLLAAMALEVEIAGKKWDRPLGPCYWRPQCSNGVMLYRQKLPPSSVSALTVSFVPFDIRDHHCKFVFLLYDLSPSSVLINLLLRLSYIVSPSGSMLRTEVSPSLRSKQNFTHELVLTKVLPRAYSACV